MRLMPLILLLGSLSVHGQDFGKAKTKVGKRLAVKVEYFGELVLHPGVSVGVDYTLATYQRVTVHWNTDLGGYWHRWNNTSAFLKTSIGSRVAMGSLFADLNLGVGYMHSWAAGVLYEKAEGDSVTKAANRGHAHLMTTACFLIGWDGSSSNLPWMLHIGPEIYLQSSFNHIFLPHIAAKIGFTYKLN